MFEKKIDMENRDEMVAFLKNHYRYFTMNSWNRHSFYANNMKIYNLGLPSDTQDKLYDLLDVEEAQERISFLLDDFAVEHRYQWQARWNGRSSGYLVLYSGGRKALEYKSLCASCGQLNYKAVEENGCRCGKDTRVNLTSPIYQAYIHRTSIDNGEDFDNWDLDELQERVWIVMDFDQLCDDIVAEAAYMAEESEVEEETYFVERTRKILTEKEPV